MSTPVNSGAVVRAIGSAPGARSAARPSGLPPAADEATMVAAYLDRERAAVRAACAALGDRPGVRLPGESEPVCAGTVAARLTRMERHWFEEVMLGRPEKGAAGAHRAGAGVSPGRAGRPALPVLLDLYDEQCSRSRTIAGRLEQRSGARGAAPGGPRVTLRWVLLHALEETSRARGRLDLLTAWPGAVRRGRSTPAGG